MPDSFDYTTGTNSENVRLLQALIDDAPEYTEETNSRNANILKSIINNTEYTDAPQSEIEELLLRLKAKIGGEIEVDELNVTENGTYDAGVNKAYNPVTVEIPLDSKTITENGTYTASDDSLAGYDEVTVNVPTPPDSYQLKSLPTGAISTIEDGTALPMPSLKVGIEAVQDLHGYDNPWPAGGGKNKFNTHAYTGIGYNTSTGTTVTLTDSTIPVTVNKNVMTYTVASWEGVAFRTPNLPSGDFHVHCETSSTVNRISVYRIGSDNVIKTVENSTASGTTIDVTRATDANDYIVIWIGSNASGNVTVTNSQVESGQSYTTWTPYENKCPISGWSAVNVNRTGKNFYNPSFTRESGYYDDNGVLQTSNTTGHTQLTPVNSNTEYYFSIHARSNGGGKFAVYFWDSNRNWISRASKDYSSDFDDNNIVFTTPNNCRFISFQIPFGTGVASLEFDDSLTMICLNSLGTDFVSYNGTTTPIQFTVNGETKTIYSGYVEVINGKVKAVAESAMVDLGSLTWSYTEATPNRFIARVEGKKRISTGGLCSIYPITTEKGIDKTLYMLDTYYGVNIIAVFDSSYSSATDFKTAMNGVQLVYPLETPIEYDLADVSISTQDGTNNLWADSGDVLEGSYFKSLN